MKSRLCSISILPLLICAPACSPTASPADLQLTRSALHDPPMVKLRQGVEYQFEEGVLMGRGQTFHSDYAYQTAFLLGQKTNWKHSPNK